MGSNRDRPQKAPSMISTTLGSAAAGIVSRIFTHPIDTAKSRLQAQYSTTTNTAKSTAGPPNYRGTLDVLTKTVRSEGVPGLYRGFGAILVGGTPGTVIYLCTYEMAKARLTYLKHELLGQKDQPKDANGDFLVHFTSGLTAEAVACIVYVPVDVIKERLQVQHPSMTNANAGPYAGSYDALKKIAKTEGLSGIYKGYGATLASFGSFSAFYFMFYERLKAESRQYLFDPHHLEMIQKEELPFLWLVLCSCSAGGLASWLTSPLDMAKLRLQVQRGQQYQQTGHPSPTSGAPTLVSYRGVWDCLQTTYHQGGVRALFRGAGARVYFFAPATTITMSCYETFYSFFDKLLSNER